MVFEEILRVVHTGAVAFYVGGAFIITIAMRRALSAVPPAQASIIGSRVGTDFTIISWLSLIAWGASGYWLLERGGWDNFGSPWTLFIDDDVVTSGWGWALLAMVAAWVVMVVNGILITFLFRPRLTRRLSPDASEEEVDRLQADVSSAARMIEVLAFINLGLAIAATLAGHRFFEDVYIY